MLETTTLPADLSGTVRQLTAHRLASTPGACPHPPTRLFTWWAYDGTLCAACCDCGAVLAGAADAEEVADG